jgi:stearoyl-CoA desaturase (delta-9 desaturase)
MARQVNNLVGLLLPFPGLVVAVMVCWRRFVEPIDLVLLAVGYTVVLLAVGSAATSLGITVGCHRLLTHRAFKTAPAVRYGLASSGPSRLRAR